jgi:hypothetical protein
MKYRKQSRSNSLFLRMKLATHRSWIHLPRKVLYAQNHLAKTSQRLLNAAQLTLTKGKTTLIHLCLKLKNDLLVLLLISLKAKIVGVMEKRLHKKRPRLKHLKLS